MIKAMKQIRLMRCVLLMAALFLVFGICCAHGAPFGTLDELEGYLREQKPAAVDIDCSDDLYKELSDKDFRGLFRMMVRTGIDYNSAQVSYSPDRRFIGLSGLNYPGFIWAECDSLTDVRWALETYSEDGRDLVMLCSETLLDRLVNDGQTLSVYAARSGIMSYGIVYSSDTGILKLTDISRFDRPWATVDDYAQFAAVTADFSARGINDFYITFDSRLFTKITEDSAEMTVMTGASKLSGYAAGIDFNACVFHFYNAEFTDAQREICRSISDVTDAIRRMGAVGVRDFELILPSAVLFDELSANDFALLQEIRTSAGMVSGEISYSSGGDRIIFRNSEIVPEVTALSTLADVIAYTEDQVSGGSRDIHLFCTTELYNALMEKYPMRIYDLLPHAGIADYELLTSDATHLINIHINHLFAGTAIILAARSGDSSALSDRELQTWATAKVIADAAENPDPLLTAASIHDWLCANVRYLDDKITDEDDNAIGAILNGEANCDGYADAFYLIGSLAGLNVRYQHGDSLDQSRSGYEDMSHLWNVLEIGGLWRMVDVTWDDEENGWSYVWFNIGSNDAARTHIWNADMTVPIAPDTQRPSSIGNDFYISDSSQLSSAVESARQRQLSTFHIIFTDPSLAYLSEEARQMVMDRCAGYSLTYAWNEKMNVLGLYDVVW